MIKISVHVLFYPIVRNLFLPFEKFFFIIRISSPRAKLNFSKSDFRQNFESHQEYFLPVWKFVITVSWSAAKEYSSRGEKSNTGGEGEDSYLPTFSTNTFDAATRRDVLASGFNDYRIFHIVHRHSSVSALHRTSRGDNFFPATHPPSSRRIITTGSVNGASIYCVQGAIVVYRFTAGRDAHLGLYIDGGTRERWWFHVLVNDWTASVRGSIIAHVMHIGIVEDRLIKSRWCCSKFSLRIFEKFITLLNVYFISSVF